MAGLEEFFTQSMIQHSQRQIVRSNRLERAKKEASAAAAKVSGLLVNSVNVGVQDCFVNEERIEMESRALAGTVQLFAKQTLKWLAAFHTFDTALKEIGDFENWITVMEYDLATISSALNFISSTDGKKSK